MLCDLEAKYVRAILSYDPLTGIFRWKEPRYKIQVGGLAGHYQKDGYLTIRIDRKSYYGHRLAWLYVHRSWPTVQLDHRDGDPRNNAISNLRISTQSQNMANTRTPSDNRSGIKGVCFDASRQRWLAYIDGRHIGRFNTFDEAKAARIEAASRQHGEFMRI